MKQWNVQDEARRRRIATGSRFASGKAINLNRLSKFLGAVIQPGDRFCLGGNKKQANVLAQALADVDPALAHHLHVVQSGEQQTSFANNARAVFGAREEVKALHVERYGMADPAYGEGVAWTIKALGSGELQNHVGRESKALTLRDRFGSPVLPKCGV